jgi:hypothetical protein
MAFDVKFRTVTAARHAPGAAIVRWSVVPYTHPQSDVRYIILRAAGPNGPWDIVDEAQVGSYQYVDYDVYSPFIVRSYYYIVRAVSVSGQGYLDSRVVSVMPDADNIAQEMVRKKLTFMLAKSGSSVAVVPRKTWGPNCNRCYNQQRQVAEDPDCPDCFGTGYTGGYLNPVYLPAIVNPAKKAVVAAGIDYDVNQIYIELANTPIVFPDDMVVLTKMNVRYTVREVTPSSHREHIVSQVCSLNRVDELSCLYNIPVEQHNGNWNLLGTDLRDSLFDARNLPS